MSTEESRLSGPLGEVKGCPDNREVRIIGRSELPAAGHNTAPNLPRQLAPRGISPNSIHPESIFLLTQQYVQGEGSVVTDLTNLSSHTIVNCN